MKTTDKQIELAVCDTHGAWTLIDDYETEEEAVQDARRIAAMGQHHINDHGVMTFGISADGSGYETKVCVDTETGDFWTQ